MDKGTDNWSQRAAFVGFDWASDHHDVVLVDQQGKVVEEFRFGDTAQRPAFHSSDAKTLRQPQSVFAVSVVAGYYRRRIVGGAT